MSFIPIIIQSNQTSWMKHSTCFEARGDESHLGISGPLGKFEVQAPCETYTDAELDTFSSEFLNINRFFQFFSYDIDDVQLYRLPESLVAQDSICQNQINLIDIRDYLPDIPVWEKAHFKWQDGYDEPVRELQGVGNFHININLDCKTIPMKLDLLDANCPAHFYAPNILSPDNDGINDYFKPFFNQAYEIDNLNLVIFDNWGNAIFETNNVNDYWDGTFKEKKLGSGSYIWTLRYQLKGFSRGHTEVGSITLVR